MNTRTQSHSRQRDIGQDGKRSPVAEGVGCALGGMEDGEYRWWGGKGDKDEGMEGLAYRPGTRILPKKPEKEILPERTYAIGCVRTNQTEDRH